MKSFASTQLKQNLGDILAAAEHEPIAITRHRKARYVLMDIETYERRFAGDPRRSYAIEEIPAEHLKLLEEAEAGLK
ncbi:type II toxin-antitoxin system prevent-host-death family antitoxin [Labrys okinawensis]|uniref:Antitoxin n=1 Tax=Labrys okinawensis TaxID=346911 RepID=A0A2S9Q4C7_9HYPH|nr:type II toxin-antitoxin system Phd/YefM family antitoxin [Labrys okinawensis]PRH84213.1 type II toxin-antitoxin system prevent-host-death family antitoxin [Labrys okinawensis]